jgi:hypothetical protein
MNVQKILEFVKGINDAEYKVENRHKLDKIIADLFNEVEENSKQEYLQREMQLYKQVLVLRYLFENLSSEMYLSKMTYNCKIDLIRKIVSDKL